MPKTALPSRQRTREGQRVGRKHSGCRRSTLFGHPGELRGVHFVLDVGLGLLASFSLASVQRGWNGRSRGAAVPPASVIAYIGTQRCVVFVFFFFVGLRALRLTRSQLLHAYRPERVRCNAWACLTEPKTHFGITIAKLELNQILTPYLNPVMLEKHRHLGLDILTLIN